MSLKFTTFLISATFATSAFAVHVNPNYEAYSTKVFNELNPNKNVQEAYKNVLDAEKKVGQAKSAFNPYLNLDARPVMSIVPENIKKNLSNAEKELAKQQTAFEEAGKKAGGITPILQGGDFVDRIASDVGSTKGPNVVGFLAGFSSAGHNAEVIEHVNTMQKAAAQYFGLNANSSYGLINGASMDGGINQRFEEAVKDGKFTPAVDKSKFKSYGAVSVNIGEWGGMMTTNKAVLLADTPPGSYEMKESAKSRSMNPEVLQESAMVAKANVHIMLTEGGEIGLKEVLEYINNHHQKGTKALIHLGIGYDGTNPAKDKGMRGASFLARHLALHPELIDSLEKSGVKFMAVAANSNRHYSDIKEYLKSPDWKTQLLKFSNANAEIKSDEFAKKKQTVAGLEEKLKLETDKDKKKALTNQIGTLKGEIALVENRVNSEAKISEYVAEFSKLRGHIAGSGPLEAVAKVSASQVEANRKAGTRVDPAEAAKAATKGIK